ncbi:DNA mismatch endonuclease Vsr [Paenibacillus sp. HJL G12]|uniref:Very short patch repair endonuclease n=1 Tax=Paenibacillus dendrobii TaxID=2691084 RepID=A0A7X3INC3_9BACL|nr:very short patch repair endonuclease [Paenibacillus dendrobii]MWV47129.1 DNA mismatch endonuclease Vsr [Paenibacillus dendrobii]
MVDTLTTEERSKMMSKIKSKNTAPEMIVRRYLHNKGFRYRLHDKKLPGKPDLILPKYKAVIFIHGCFWHGHEGCKYFRIPKSNTDYWVKKIDGNLLRDQEKQQLLRDMGWKVSVVWECELKRNPEYRCLKLIEQITT